MLILGELSISDESSRSNCLQQHNQRKGPNELEARMIDDMKYL